MKVSVRELRGKKAYLKGQKDPIGVFSDGVLDKEKGILTGYVIKTLSLVPLSKVINKDDIEKIEKDKVILKKETKVKSLDILKTKTIKTDDISSVIMPDFKKCKAGDICFDFETGKMCDIVVSKGILGSKQRVALNKICLKENTIYIQKEGGDKNV